MTLPRLFASAAALLAMTTAHAQAPTPAELERTLTGRWMGELVYRDYQSDRRFTLPVRTEVRLADDGATLTRESRFDDGPARGTVLITTVSLYDDGGTRVTAASFRRGRAVETVTEQARVLEHGGAADGKAYWKAEWLSRGIDGGQASDIRITVTRRGDELRSVKEVRALQPAGGAEAPWVFRNETVLRRQP
jgi:hypothetical protein